MFARKLVCLRETYASLRQMRARWPGQMPGHRRRWSMGMGVRFRARRRPSPLLFRLFNRGNVEWAARIWCAFAKRDADRNGCARPREERLRFVPAHCAWPKEDRRMVAFSGRKAGEFAGQKRPAPPRQVIESHGDFAAEKISEKFALLPVPDVRAAFKGWINRRRRKFGACDANLNFLPPFTARVSTHLHVSD